MRNLFIIKTLITLSVVTLVACSEDGETTKKKSPPKIDAYQGRVIYGDDNRKDIYDISNSKHFELADSTVALVNKRNISEQGDWVHLNGVIFKHRFDAPLCEEERFREQLSAAFCSGFLVAPNMIATAGHCIRTEGKPDSDCSVTRFVFNFSLTHQDDPANHLSKNEVYSCKRIVAREFTSNQDWALIELDRPVENHRPLNIRKEGQPQTGDALVVIGHPTGLPKKVADGASVRSVHTGFLKANLDTYGGNSGSAVFSDVTGEVEGILVRGVTDFIKDKEKGCVKSNRCSESGCGGEDVTLIQYLLPYL